MVMREEQLKPADQDPEVQSEEEEVFPEVGEGVGAEVIKIKERGGEAEV